MKPSTPQIEERPLTLDEERAWGHDFNAEGIFANNQGQAMTPSATGSPVPPAAAGSSGLRSHTRILTPHPCGRA